MIGPSGYLSTCGDGDGGPRKWTVPVKVCLCKRASVRLAKEKGRREEMKDVTTVLKAQREKQVAQEEET